MSAWPRHMQWCSSAGFNYLGCAPLFMPGSGGDPFLTDDPESIDPRLEEGGAADDVIGRLSDLCRQNGLNLLLDIVPGRMATDGALVRSAPRWFTPAGAARGGVMDPRVAPIDRQSAFARFDDDAATEGLLNWWTDRLVRLARAGVAGFRLVDLRPVPAAFLRRLIEAVRRESECLFLAWTPGLGWPAIRELAGIGLDGVFSSSAWWDGKADWLVEEHEVLRRVAPVLGSPQSPGPDQGPAHESADMLRWALHVAAATSSGLLVPMGYGSGIPPGNHRRDAPTPVPEPDPTMDVRKANDLVDRIWSRGAVGEMRALTGPDSSVTALLRADADDVREADQAVVVLINTDHARILSAPITLSAIGPHAGASLVLDPREDAPGALSPLRPNEVRLVDAVRTTPVRLDDHRPELSINVAMRAARVVIENISPAVDCGRFAVKRVVGEPVTVEADIFTDGHEVLAAELLWRPADESDWQQVPLQKGDNDRWRAEFTPSRIGRHLFTVEAWRDDYATLCRDIGLKRAAGMDISLEIEEGRRHIEATLAYANSSCRAELASALVAFAQAGGDARATVLLAADTRAAAARAEERRFAIRHEPSLRIDVDRPQAAFAGWYELFPRSQTRDPKRHGTFDDVIERLPDIRAMGFDVLYFTPIHPIGRTNRKGRNNSLTAGPDDLGSPYAIGGPEGGHDAIHPALGTPEDFRRLVAAAADHGLEVALDFAIQCSPDHPWLRDHPGWFSRRPDGSIRFAENPPKKYEDIVNVDFYAEAALPDLWLALRDVVLHWVGEGVRTFRVDNPHTKPLPFWQWMIASVRAQHPDVIFLSEAFTRPKMMYRLAKIGFTQSYTYFTWRNAKKELTDYLVELTTTEAREHFRPHFFVNTPDINPVFLQSAGRPGFLIRAALAATLSGLWGVYSGFELCESAPLPGREEYLDSEKYQIRVRDQNAPGNIVAEITALNRIRRANPALHTHLGVTFYNAFNDRVMLYGKRLPGQATMILVAVSLDPHVAQETTYELPLWEWKLPDTGSLAIEDLMSGRHFVLTGKLQHLRLDPAALPFAIWRLSPVPGAAP